MLYYGDASLGNIPSDSHTQYLCSVLLNCCILIMSLTHGDSVILKSYLMNFTQPFPNILPFWAFKCHSMATKYVTLKDLKGSKSGWPKFSLIGQIPGIYLCFYYGLTTFYF